MAVRVRLNNSKIRGLTGRRGGAIYDYVADEVGPLVVKEIKVRTPIRSGRLHRAIKVLDVIPGPRETTIRVGAKGVINDQGKPYVMKVVRGTGGHGVQYGGRGKNHPIGFALMADGVQFGKVNRRPGKPAPGVPQMFAKNFRGQEANDFMQNGLRAALDALGLR